MTRRFPVNISLLNIGSAFRSWQLKRFWLVLVLASCFPCLHAAAIEDSSKPKQNWPQWRGPLGTGTAPDAHPPLDWNEQENIRWKTELPGKGHSTPIIWGDHIFLTTAIPFGESLKPKFSDAPGAHDNLPVTQHHKFVVVCVDRNDGKILWQKTVREALPHEGAHYTASLASASPVTDGELLFAFFGSFGLYCLDFDGNLLWEKDFGLMHSKHGHGEGSSPALYGNTVIINWDHEEDSFLVALNKTTGEQIWKADRAEETSWASPIIVEHNGKQQVIVAGTDRVRGYDLATGASIWECRGMSSNIVATPVAADGVVYVGSSYEKKALLAIRLDGAEGDITGTNRVAWSRDQRTPYVPSMLFYDDTLYFLTHYQGILSRVTGKTGEEKIGPLRLDGFRDIYASPVAAADRVYITDREGKTLVISHDETPRVLALNRLDDSFSASAVLVNSELFLRGEKYLYCIAEK